MRHQSHRCQTADSLPVASSRVRRHSGPSTVDVVSVVRLISARHSKLLTGDDIARTT